MHPCHAAGGEASWNHTPASCSTGESSQQRRGGRVPSKERDVVYGKIWRQEGTQHSQGEKAHPGECGQTKWIEGALMQDAGRNTKWKGHFKLYYGDIWRRLEAEIPVKMEASPCARTEGIRHEVKG